MKARLAILLVIFGAVLVYQFTREKPVDDPNAPISEDDGVVSEGPIDFKGSVSELPPPGDPPPTEPNVLVVVRPDNSNGQNRVYCDVSESHGYFVPWVRVNLMYSASGFEQNDEVRVMELFIDWYTKTNETMTYFTQLVDPEMEKTGNNLGEGRNWRADILQIGPCREKNPDPSWEGWKVKKPRAAVGP